jgi:hypothetical protein
MRTLTNNECAKWIDSIGLAGDPVSRRVSLRDDTGYVFTVRWPKILPYQVPYFATLFLPGDSNAIDDCLFWLADNGACNSREFDLAVRLLELLRASHQEIRPILESPAYSLTGADSVDARMLLTMAMLFSWDCYVVPQHGRYFIWIDDDEAADIWCKNREDYDRIATRFREFGVIPEEAPGMESQTNA